MNADKVRILDRMHQHDKKKRSNWHTTFV